MRIRTNQNKAFSLRHEGKKERKKKEEKKDRKVGKQAEAGRRFFGFFCLVLYGFDPYNLTLWGR